MMWKWTIKFDKAFEIPTYRVKADGFIVGTIKQSGTKSSPGASPRSGAALLRFGRFVFF